MQDIDQQKSDLTLLKEFVLSKMSMTANYQPVIIRELLRRNGRVNKEELALALLLADVETISYWESILMRWPKLTLQNKHSIVHYDSKTQVFQLLHDLSDSDLADEIIDICDKKIAEFSKPLGTKIASLRYSLIEESKGMCQACGAIPSTTNTLDIDHIIPKSKAKNGKVKTAQNETVDVDDKRNLQVLCAKCNRGKRDSGSFNFKPDKTRLEHVIVNALVKARELGFSTNEILEAANSKLSEIEFSNVQDL